MNLQNAPGNATREHLDRRRARGRSSSASLVRVNNWTTAQNVVPHCMGIGHSRALRL